LFIICCIEVQCPQRSNNSIKEASVIVMNEATKEQGYGNSRNRAPMLRDLPKKKRQQHPNSKKNPSGGKHTDPSLPSAPPPGKDNDPQQKRKDKKQNKRQLQLAAMKKKADDEDRYFRQCQAQRHVPQRLSTEKELFGGSTQGAQGINFGKYNDIQVEVKRANDASSVQFENFDTLSLHPTLRLNISLMNYTAPTPIQKHSIPLAMEGDDLMCCAQTGSGKTCAFLLPVVSQLLNPKAHAAQAPATNTGPAQPRCVILAPTRELAIQIELEAQKLCFSLPQLHPVTVYGGVNARAQLKELAFGAHIIVATPGRLTDFVDRGIVSLAEVQYLILDEADRMLDMGFEPQIRKLVLQSNMTKKEQRQTFMFSATFEPAIQKLAATFLRNDYTWIAVGRVGSTTDSITQVLVQATADKRKKLALVVKAIEEGPSGRTLVFVQKKSTATWLKKQLLQGGPPDGNPNFTRIPAEDIHGDRSQSQREAALLKFREGTCRVLVATDVAARGLDIAGVEHVINMDLPTSVEDFDSYVHRIGRTGRVGHTGLATSLFVNELNGKIASRLVQQLKGAKQDVPKWLEDMVAGGGGVARSGVGGGAPQKKAVTGGGGSNRSGGSGVSRKEALAGGGVVRSGGGGASKNGAAVGGGAVNGNRSGGGGASRKGAADAGGAFHGNRSGGGGASKKGPAGGRGAGGNRSAGGGASKKKAAAAGGGVNR
jgi:ATP-dependent RNA helicase DDX3X